MILVLAMISLIGNQKQNKKKNRQEGLYQIQKLLLSKGNNKQNKESPMGWEEIFANYISDKW